MGYVDEITQGLADRGLVSSVYNLSDDIFQTTATVTWYPQRRNDQFYNGEISYVNINHYNYTGQDGVWVLCLKIFIDEEKYYLINYLSPHLRDIDEVLDNISIVINRLWESSYPSVLDLIKFKEYVYMDTEKDKYNYNLIIGPDYHNTELDKCLGTKLITEEGKMYSLHEKPIYIFSDGKVRVGISLLIGVELGTLHGFGRFIVRNHSGEVLYNFCTVGLYYDLIRKDRLGFIKELILTSIIGISRYYNVSEEIIEKVSKDGIN